VIGKGGQIEKWGRPPGAVPGLSASERRPEKKKTLDFVLGPPGAERGPKSRRRVVTSPRGVRVDADEDGGRYGTKTPEC